MSPKKPVVGIDVGHSSIKVALVSGNQNSQRLEYLSEVQLEKPFLAKNGVAETNLLAKKISQAFHEAKPKPLTKTDCGTALPESLVFTKLITFPSINPNFLDKAIRHQASEFLPFPVEEVNLDWRIISPKDSAKLEVLIIAAPKKLVSCLSDAFSAAGLKLKFIETKPISAARALTNDGHREAVILIDIGSEASSVSIAEDSSIKITSTIRLGSVSMIKSIAEVTKCDEKTAAEIFTTKGLLSEGKEKIIIEQAMNPLIEEVSKLIKYYRSRIDSALPISEVRIYGGGSQLKGITSYFQGSIKIKTILANPLLNIKTYPKAFLSPNLLRFSVAIGLSLRGA